MSKKFSLTKPIDTHKGQIKEIELREPTVKELKDLGEFVKDGDMRWGTLIDWISRLSGHDGPAIETMAPRDLGPIAKWISDELQWDVPEKNSA